MLSIFSCTCWSSAFKRAGRFMLPDFRLDYKATVPKTVWCWHKNQMHRSTEHFITLYTKLNSKWLKVLNAKPDTIKLPEESISRTLLDMNHSNIWGGGELSPKEKEMKAKLNEWDLVKLKSFYTLEKIIVKIKIQPNEWEKIFANNMTNKELIFSIHKQFI